MEVLKSTHVKVDVALEVAVQSKSSARLQRGQG